MSEDTNKKQCSVCHAPWQVMSIKGDGRVALCDDIYDDVCDQNGVPYRVQNTPLNEIFHSNYMKDIRDRMRSNDTLPPQCWQCSLKDKLGMRSNKHDYGNNETDMGDEFWLTDTPTVKNINIMLNNVCNLKCLMCGPWQSSAWKTESLHMKQFLLSEMDTTYGYTGDANSKLWQSVEECSSTLQRLEVMGGEPLFTPQFEKLTQQLIDSGHASHISLIFATNCTLFNGPFVERLAQHFERVFVIMSIDGVGPMIEYQRFPCNWDTVHENMLKYKEISSKYSKFKARINFVLGWMNIFNVHNMHKIAKDELCAVDPFHSVRIYHIVGPHYMALWAIPTKFKPAVEQFINIEYASVPATATGLINFLYSQEITDEQFLENLRVFRKHDKYRGNDLLAAVPEWAPLLKPYWDQILAEDNI